MSTERLLINIYAGAAMRRLLFTNKMCVDKAMRHGIMFFTVIDRKVRTDEIQIPFRFITMVQWV